MTERTGPRLPQVRGGRAGEGHEGVPSQLGVIRVSGVGDVGHLARERVLTMPRARRLASTVVVAALAVTGLAACNRAPSVAAYIGNAKAVTEDQVQRVYNDAQAKFTAVAGGTKTLPVTRQEIVDELLGVDVLREIAKQRGVPATAIPADTFVKYLGLPADAEYTKLYTELQGLVDAIGQRTTAVQPTEADLRDIYNRLKGAGAQNTYEQFTAGLSAAARQQIAKPLGLRNDLRAESANLHITVNPRYTTPTVPVFIIVDGNGALLALVDVALGGSASAPVTDLP
jgi:hypothetical protein